jgi:hypothetical protein
LLDTLNGEGRLNMYNTRCKQEIHTREQLGFRYRWENNIKWTLEKYGMKV